MEKRLTKPAGRNATYRKERILEIIDKLTEIENIQQRNNTLLPKDLQERQTTELRYGAKQGNTAAKNNKLFYLENLLETGELVSREWHEEQLAIYLSEKDNNNGSDI